MNKTQASKPIHEIIQSYATTFSLILVPFVVAGISAFVAYTQNNNQNAAEYIKIGVSILTIKPDKNNKNTRAWAIDLINHYAPVKIPVEAKNELINTNELPKTVLDKLMDNSNDDSMHHFEWNGQSSDVYSVEIQIFKHGKWELYSGVSVTGTSFDIALPKSEKIRWQVKNITSQSADVNQQSDWKLINN